MIEDCLSRAEISETQCLDGVSKADIALDQTQGDPDIECIVLMKRAQLLYIAVCVCSCACVCGGVWVRVGVCVCVLVG